MRFRSKVNEFRLTIAKTLNAKSIAYDRNKSQKV